MTATKKIYHDFDNWDRSLFDYAKQLISNKDILEFNNNDLLAFSNDYKSKCNDLFHQIIEAHLYWIGFGVGIECLAKAVLIKHNVMTITKRKFSSNLPPQFPTSFPSYDDKQAYQATHSPDIYQKVYLYVESIDIQVTNGTWLDNEFVRLNIRHPFEINTPTLGSICNTEIQKLLIANIITNDESNLLKNGLELFTKMRRNVDAHVFLKSRVIGSINSDIENVYIPIINLLVNIYKRPAPHNRITSP